MIKPIREEQEKAKREKDSFAISLPVPGKIFFVVVLNAGKIRLGMLGGCATNNRSVYRGRPANILSSIARGGNVVRDRRHWEIVIQHYKTYRQGTLNSRNCVECWPSKICEFSSSSSNEIFFFDFSRIRKEKREEI
jgi:hypothetical protein